MGTEGGLVEVLVGEVFFSSFSAHSNKNTESSGGEN